MGFLLAVVGLYTLASSEVPRRIIATLASMSLAATFVVMYLRTRGMSRPTPCSWSRCPGSWRWR